MDKNRNELPQQPGEVPESFCFVIFDECGGNNDVINREVAYGKTVKIPTPPKRTGYDKMGWWKDAECTDRFDFDIVYAEESLTLYLKWGKHAYTVTFNSQGGSNVTAQSVLYLEQATEPAEPTRQNCTFAGWYLNDTEFNFATPIENNITLMARWQVTVTFDSDGGSTISSQTIDEGACAIRLATNPTYGNNVFINWYMDVDHTTVFDFTQPITSNTTIYALWAMDIVNDCIFTAIDGGYSLTKYNNSNNYDAIIIPAKYNGQNVVTIDSNVFRNCNSLTNITISEGVTSIGDNAFYNCSKLVTINCRAVSPPSGWKSNWNANCNTDVVWGYTSN